MRELSKEEKDDFLNKHLRHRLTLLRTLRERKLKEYNYSSQGDIYRCVKDSNLIAVRLLMDFLGIKGVFKNGDYELDTIKKRHDNDIKLDQFSIRLLLPSDVSTEFHRTLAGVYVRGDKELAHLTSIFNDEFNAENELIKAATILEGLLVEFLYEPLGVQLPEQDI